MTLMCYKALGIGSSSMFYIIILDDLNVATLSNISTEVCYDLIFVDQY